MRYAITPEVLAAIRAALPAGHGGQTKFAQSCGISASALASILCGRKRVVLDDLWRRIVLGVPQLASVAPVPASAPLLPSPVETFRRAVLDAIMAEPSLSPDQKVALYNCVSAMPATEINTKLTHQR